MEQQVREFLCHCSDEVILTFMTASEDCVTLRHGYTKEEVEWMENSPFDFDLVKEYYDLYANNATIYKFTSKISKESVFVKFYGSIQYDGDDYCEWWFVGNPND
jgi:hypothetical protein